MARYAVLVIDMLEEFVKGRLKAPAAEKIVPNIGRLLEHARSKNIPVIYLADSHYKGVDFELKLWGDHAIKGSPESKIIDELKPRDGDYVIYKRRYDGFMFTDLDMLLRELGVDTVILTGIHTHICVQNTALGAFYRGYRVIVPRDCVAAFSDKWHEYGIRYMKEFIGAKITTLDKLISELK